MMWCSRTRKTFLPAVAMLAVLAGSPVCAGEAVTPTMRADIAHVIAAQIEAFRHGDGTTALGFAAPALRRQFGDGAHFLDMVRTAYQPIFRPLSFEFGELATDDDKAVQKVVFVGTNGDVATAIYDMQRQDDGQWRIAGCSLIRSGRIET